MKYTIVKEHRDFFQKHGSVEFEDLLSSDQLLAFNQSIDISLSNRCSVSSNKINQLTAEQQFLAGHDLWRDDSNVKKFVTQFQISEVASELVEQRHLRLGYAQLFISRMKTQYPQNKENVYCQFLEQRPTLAEMSSVQDVHCGLMLALTNPIEMQPDREQENREGCINPFSFKAGSGVFFQPDRPIDFNQIYEHIGQRFMLIVYVHQSAIYQIQNNDPHKHYLKRLGYGVGDRLTDKWHPMLIR